MISDEVSQGSVLVTVPDGRVVEVDGGENREDVGLQEGDENLEPGQEDQHEERQDAGRHEERLRGLSSDQRFGQQTERDQ